MLRKAFFVLMATGMLLAACAAPTPAPVEPTLVPLPTVPAAPVEPTPTFDPNCLLRMATTTSTDDSGLLDYLMPIFKAKYGCEVDVVAVGSGQAFEIGRAGDADVLLVHSRKAEDEFVAAGEARERFDVMHNDLILVGPTDDPAGAASATSAADALKAIAAANAPFASRGDKSGTHTKELALWAAAGIEPAFSGYNSLGQKMGETLLFSEEKSAYTLTDRATYLAMADQLPHLGIVFGGHNIEENLDKTLLNPYGIMAVNPDKHPGVNYTTAMQMVEWFIAPVTQDLIANFGVAEFGQPLFYPDALPD
jgi:tungstate transport system substrate-binding protein